MKALALLLALGAGTAAAQARMPPVVLCTTDFPPYVSTEAPDGGRITALARRAFEAAGLKVQTQQLPWVRAYALAKSGEFAGASLWSGAVFAVHDGTKAETRPAAYLYEKERGKE